jgi:hypothetical protein
MRYLLLAFSLLVTPLFAGSIIKCEAEDGAVTYADSRCPAGHKQVSKKSYRQVQRSSQASVKNLEKASEFPDSAGFSTIPKQLFQARFIQALSALSALKYQLVEHRLYRGQWPKSIADLGLDPKQMNSSQIASTEVAEHGRLKASLRPDLGDNKVIWLYPREVMGGTQLEWTCYSNYPLSMLTTPSGQRLCESRYF